MELPDNVKAMLTAAQTFLTGNPQLDPKAAIRRAVRTSSWQHDPDRLAAAEAKRARKRGRAICR